MEDFMKALGNVHKICKGDITHREPSNMLLPEEEYPVPLVEFENMIDLMEEVYQEDIQKDKKNYNMLNDVMSCMRDTGMMDSYLYLIFTRGEEAYIIADMFAMGLINTLFGEDDYDTIYSTISSVEYRVGIIKDMMMPIRDPMCVEKNNERYGNMDEILVRMGASLKAARRIHERKQEDEKSQGLSMLSQCDVNE